MKLDINDANMVLEAENKAAGLPTRGVHIRPDGTVGMSEVARYVDLDSDDKPGWVHRVREPSDDLPLEVVEAVVESLPVLTKNKLKTQILAEKQKEPTKEIKEIKR
jgi:hypothetical protein